MTPEARLLTVLRLSCDGWLPASVLGRLMSETGFPVEATAETLNRMVADGVLESTIRRRYPGHQGRSATLYRLRFPT